MATDSAFETNQFIFLGEMKVEFVLDGRWVSAQAKAVEKLFPSPKVATCGFPQVDRIKSHIAAGGWTGQRPALQPSRWGKWRRRHSNYDRRRDRRQLPAFLPSAALLWLIPAPNPGRSTKPGTRHRLAGLADRCKTAP